MQEECDGSQKEHIKGNEKNEIIINSPKNSNHWEGNNGSVNLTAKSKYLKRGKKMYNRLNEEQKKQSVKQAKKTVS